MPKLLAACLPASLKDGPERLAFLMIAGAISLTLVSIAASQILLATAVAATIWLWKKRGKAYFSLPPIAWPLLAFCLWTLLTISVSPDVRVALGEVKKFFIYLIVFIVPTMVQGKGRTTWIYRAIFAVTLLSCLKGIAQFIANPHRGLLDRISGFMSQWMTYSGLLMLSLVALAAFVVCLGWRKHKWVIPLSLMIIAPLVLSQTRNAWGGAVVGIVMVVLLRRPRAIAGLLVVIMAVYLLSPTIIKQRLHSGWNPEDPNTRNRIELFGTALRLIRDNPWVGVGPKNVNRESLRYRGSYQYADWMYQHMHNNFLQMAAERGIPGLLIWLWFMGRLAWDAFRVFRSARSLPSSLCDADNNEVLMASTAALGAWAALIAAGMFEYNFGDSEVLTLFLFMTSVPYAFLNNRHRRSTGNSESSSEFSAPPR